MFRIYSDGSLFFESPNKTVLIESDCTDKSFMIKHFAKDDETFEIVCYPDQASISFYGDMFNDLTFIQWWRDKGFEWQLFSTWEDFYNS